MLTGRHAFWLRTVRPTYTQLSGTNIVFRPGPPSSPIVQCWYLVYCESATIGIGRLNPMEPLIGRCWWTLWPSTLHSPLCYSYLPSTLFTSIFPKSSFAYYLYTRFLLFDPIRLLYYHEIYVHLRCCYHIWFVILVLVQFVQSLKCMSPWVLRVACNE